ncbi:tetratricopeptide repeat protein [Methyloglobulus sp.]|uniref:tetratricopeptide repeat protein n=1 Tax=Methyloglobulus sp. TaxID=2518622 RepID=UPI00398903F5
MADQLPQITGSRAVNATATPTASLIGRGLSAIQNKGIGIAQTELDARYRKARDVYDRITDYSWEYRFKCEDMPKRDKQFDVFEDNPLQPYFDLLQQLADVFKVFQELADQGYGRAYFPLARMYWGGLGINRDTEKKEYYSRSSFSFCLANQTLNELEIWSDLGWMYDNGHGIQQDYQQAVFWYRKAAEQGYAIAQYVLGYTNPNRLSY